MLLGQCLSLEYEISATRKPKRGSKGSKNGPKIQIIGWLGHLWAKKGQKWAKNPPKWVIWVIVEVWSWAKRGKKWTKKREKCVSWVIFKIWSWVEKIKSRSKKVQPEKIIPATKNLNPAKKKLIPAKLGKFLGSQVGPFWPSGGLRGHLRKSKMQKNLCRKKWPTLKPKISTKSSQREFYSSRK